jgi:hypothetical protein
VDDFGVVDPGLAQVGAGRGGEFGVAFQRDDAAGLVAQQGADVAGERADMQHGVTFAQIQVLDEPGFDAGCEQRTALVQGNFEVHEGLGLVCGRNKVFTADGGQQLQNRDVQDIPGADLLLDHVEAGLFDVHAGHPKGDGRGK